MYTPSRISSIDVVKGIAMLMVLTVHTAHIAYCPFPDLAKFGQMGCQIFLIFSAYTLCLSFSKNEMTYTKYITHRYMRLASGYWIAIALYVFLVCLSIAVSGSNFFQAVHITPVRNIFANLLLLNGLTPNDANNNLVLGGWFVGTLFLFYIIFPLLYRVYFKRTNNIWVKYRPYIFPMCILLLSLLCQYLLINYCNRYNFTTENNDFLYFSIVNQLPCIVLGISLYDILSRCKRNSLMHNVLVGGGGLILLIVSFEMFFFKWKYIYTIVPFVFGCAVFCLLYIILQNSSCKLFKNFIAGLLQKIGLNSFGIYLLHPIITYYLIPLIYPLSDRCISHFISDTATVCAVNFLLCLALVLTFSSLLTVYFNKIQRKLYSGMENLMKRI